ncbi:MAG: transposase [SAR324 cluster bacterium]|nr:transposase [SAR324 cluster bacterium]
MKEARACLEEEERQAQREQEAPRGRIPSNATLRERKLLTQRGRTAYKKRGATIEPVFGQMAMRSLNRFWLRGIGKVKGEWSLWQRHARPGAGDGARAISRSAPMAWLREVDTPP